MSIFKIKNLWQILIIFASLLLVMRANSQSKARLDLDDLSIKGELLNDGRLNIIGRERLSLQNFVKFRTNYRQIMIQELPTPSPKRRN